MEPAQTIIKKLGGPSAVAKVLSIHRTRVSSWQRSRASGGTDGRIPQGHIERLLDHARTSGIALQFSDFNFVKPRARARVVRARPRAAA